MLPASQPDNLTFDLDILSKEAMMSQHNLSAAKSTGNQNAAETVRKRRSEGVALSVTVSNG